MVLSATVEFCAYRQPAASPRAKKALDYGGAMMLFLRQTVSEREQVFSPQGSAEAYGVEDSSTMLRNEQISRRFWAAINQ